MLTLAELPMSPVAYWGYEQAFATDHIIVFDRDNDMDGIQREWSDMMGVGVDNKVTFEMQLEHGAVVYVTFHDCKVYFGLGVRPYHSKEHEPKRIKPAPKPKPVLTQPGQEVDKPTKAHSANLKTIILAAKVGALGLMECEFKATGEKVAVLCVFSEDDNKQIHMTPFAVLLNGNPYEMLNPPNPDGGFHKS